MTVLPELLELPLAINLLAVFFGALGGTIRAGEDEHTDIVGVFTLAAAMGFGGGIIRDVLLGNLPPAAIRDPLYFVAAFVAAAIGMGFLYYLHKLGRFLWWLDSIIIGLFACVGVNTALLAGVKILPAVVIGMIASVGGLMLTDILQGRPSSIMYLGPPNAVSGLAGAITYGVLISFVDPILTTVLATAATIGVRLTGPLFHTRVPQPRKHAYELKVRTAFKRARKEGTLPEGLGDLAPGTGALAAVSGLGAVPALAEDPESISALAPQDEPVAAEPEAETIYIDEYSPGLGSSSAAEEWIASLEDEETGESGEAEEQQPA
ncbi:trimeric intracellular cation channel family protein [Demequina mangrovi]|uniref:Uncharacterized membrane protein YeiH n=1 Tax=Demequina mangrovi TaxID=1043493 RepID=A0A1H6WYJ4_9MICO|nr:TRIC cation channel family protein [Demequina mangrovi]SEJ21943.1 Uncharacterized membrane protein YeiH [Demequina mangrovi]